MAEYIEREAVYNTLKAKYCDECTDKKCQMCEYADIMFVLDNLPIANVQPIRRGRWIELPEGWACSFCGNFRGKAYSSNFCSFCGADMFETKKR